METAHQKNKFVWLSLILLVLLVVTTVGWLRSNAELSKLTKVDNEFAQYEDSLAVCEKAESLDGYDLCVQRLSELSKLLSRYEEKLRNIQLPARQ